MTRRNTALLCGAVIALASVALGAWFTTRTATTGAPRPEASVRLRPLPPHVENPIPDGWTATHVPSTFTLGNTTGGVLTITAEAGGCETFSHVELLRQNGRVRVLAWNRELTIDLPDTGCGAAMTIGEYRFQLPSDLQDARFEAAECDPTSGSGDEVACREVQKAARR